MKNAIKLLVNPLITDYESAFGLSSNIDGRVEEILKEVTSAQKIIYLVTQLQYFNTALVVTESRFKNTYNKSPNLIKELSSPSKNFTRFCNKANLYLRTIEAYLNRAYLPGMLVTCSKTQKEMIVIEVINQVPITLKCRLYPRGKTTLIKSTTEVIYPELEYLYD